VLKYPNNNVDLSALTVKQGSSIIGAMTPDFSATATTYQVVLPANIVLTSTVTIAATASSNVAKVYIGNDECVSKTYTVSTLLPNVSVPINVVSPTGVSKSYTIQFSKALYTVVGSTTEPDLMVKFGIKTSGYTSHNAADVTAAFNALHAYINDSTKFNTSTTNDTVGNVVHLGDYIDLASLSVTAWVTGGVISATNTDLDPKGKLLRIMVVGINSFNRRTTQPKAHVNTPHVIFHFQNVPGFGRMNPSNDNTSGYAGSEMRSYIVDRMMKGLRGAGVPEDVLWSPQRRVWVGTVNDVQAITDTIWLPTEREIYGLVDTAYTLGPYSNAKESAANQAHFEYYDTDAKRAKYDSTGVVKWYWKASPSITNTNEFCSSHGDGRSDDDPASTTTGGIVPAFCVR
jgi:hypothetical protein